MTKKNPLLNSSLTAQAQITKLSLHVSVNPSPTLTDVSFFPAFLLHFFAVESLLIGHVQYKRCTCFFVVCVVVFRALVGEGSITSQMQRRHADMSFIFIGFMKRAASLSSHLSENISSQKQRSRLSTFHNKQYETMMFSRSMSFAAAAALVYGASSSAAFAPSTCEWLGQFFHMIYLADRERMLLSASFPLTRRRVKFSVILRRARSKISCVQDLKKSV